MRAVHDNLAVCVLGDVWIGSACSGVGASTEAGQWNVDSTLDAAHLPLHGLPNVDDEINFALF